MKFYGVTDSAVSVAHESLICRRCGSSARIGNGLCVSCLLQPALEGTGTNGDALAAMLAEVNLNDADWRVGNYQILEEIGRGGMGVIYRARQRHSKRIVALKRVLSFHADSRETLARFRREAQAAASLDHPNILPIYEVGETEDKLPFFSMKLAVGGALLNLKQALRNDPREVVRLLSKVTRAVQYAHSQGILHRDLKPGNILLDGRGEPLVSDFGLAKWLDTSSDLTRTLTIFGTPGYIAPEQANGPAANLKPTADVYSIGAIIFDLLAGRPPFLGEHALAVIKQAAEKTAPKLRTIVPHADRDLETICARCLEREPSARYQSAHDLAIDLELWLEGRPIVARPVSPPVRVWRWSKRNPKLAGSVAACLALGAAAVTWQTQSRQLVTAARDRTLQTHSVSVLPLLDLDTLRSDPEIAKVIAASLQRALSRRGPARVLMYSNASPSNVGRDAIREIGSQAHTRTVLSGTRRLADGKLRLSLRLMDAETGDQLLVRTANFEASNKIESEVSKLGAEEIYSILNGKDWTGSVLSVHDPGLRDPYVKELIIAGRDLTFHTTLTDVERAVDCLRKAVELAPKSALAHAYLSSAAGVHEHYVPDKRFLELAEAEARIALNLEPNSSDAHRALSGVLYEKGRFLESIEEQLKTAELAGPEEKIARFVGNTLGLLGRPDRSLDWYAIARQQELRPGENDALIGDGWAKLCDDERAEAAYIRAGRLGPELDLSWLGLCHLRLLQGRFDAARALCEKNQGNEKNFLYGQQMSAQVAFFSRHWVEAEQIYRDLMEKNPAGGGTFFGAVNYESALGRLRLEFSDKRSAKAILEKALEQETVALEASPEHPEILYRIAAVNASLGRVTSALDRLDAAIRAGWIDYRSLSLDPRFDSLRNEKRFQQILNSLATHVTELRRQRLAVEVVNN
jgi:serine/threonine protein kinase/tetratricopeptide (TPR) repeat protein